MGKTSLKDIIKVSKELNSQYKKNLENLNK